MRYFCFYSFSNRQKIALKELLTMAVAPAPEFVPNVWIMEFVTPSVSAIAHHVSSDILVKEVRTDMRWQNMVPSVVGRQTSKGTRVCDLHVSIQTCIIISNRPNKCWTSVHFCTTNSTIWMFFNKSFLFFMTVLFQRWCSTKGGFLIILFLYSQEKTILQIPKGHYIVKKMKKQLINTKGAHI